MRTSGSAAVRSPAQRYSRAQLRPHAASAISAVGICSGMTTQLASATPLSPTTTTSKRLKDAGKRPVPRRANQLRVKLGIEHDQQHTGRNAEPCSVTVANAGDGLQVKQGVTD